MGYKGIWLSLALPMKLNQSINRAWVVKKTSEKEVETEKGGIKDKFAGVDKKLNTPDIAYSLPSNVR